MLRRDTDAGYRAARLAARWAATVSACGPPHALRSRASNARVARYRNLRRANGRAARAVGDPFGAKHQRLEQPLHDTNRQHRAPNVLEQQEPPTRSQHAANLGHRSAIIGDCAKRQRAHHAVEPFVGKVERLRIADTQICVAAELACTSASNLQHRRAELHARQPHTLAVERQVAAGPDRDLEHLTLRLRTDPLATATKEQLLEDPHLAVVLVRLPLVESENPLRLALATLKDVVGHWE